MSKNIKKFTDVREACKNLRGDIYARGTKLLIRFTSDAHDTVKEAYGRIKGPVNDDSGNQLNEVPNNKLGEFIANSVRMTIKASGTVSVVYLDGPKANLEALRWYAYSNKPPHLANPFIAARDRLRDREVIRTLVGEVEAAEK